jgi:hypothetical protein
MMKALSLIAEFMKLDELYGTFTRPDSSGNRMGLDRKPLSADDEFPYGSDADYGQPKAYDRGSRGAGPSHRQWVAKSAKRNPWDEADEAMGSPTFIAKAVQGAQIGHATGIPGASGPWANNPVRPWDENDVLDHEDEGYLDAKGFTLDPVVPEVEPVPNSEPTSWHDQTDDEVEKKLDRIWKKDNNPSLSPPPTRNVPQDIFVVGSPMGFMQGLGLSMRPSRGLYGMIPKESIWTEVFKALACKK